MNIMHTPTPRVLCTLTGGLLAAASLLHALPAQAGPADLDPGFGDGGRLILDEPGLLVDVLPLTNDSILYLAVYRDQMRLGRLLSSGQPDSSFGENGIVELAQAAGRQGAVGMFALPPDRVLVVGRREAQMFGTDGFLEVGFADLGTLVFAEEISTAAVDAAGRLHTVRFTGDRDAASLRLRRYTSSGEPDTGFAQDGLAEMAYFPLRAGTPAGRMTVTDSAIVLAGGVRLNAQPHLDTAITQWDLSGRPRTDFGDGGRAVLQQDREDAALGLVMAGEQAWVFGPNGRLVQRLREDGRSSATLFSTPASYAALTGLGLRSGGFVLAGSYDGPESQCDDMMLSMVDAQGRPVPGFIRSEYSTATPLHIDLLGGCEAVTALAEMPSGRLLLAGGGVQDRLHPRGLTGVNAPLKFVMLQGPAPDGGAAEAQPAPAARSSIALEQRPEPVDEGGIGAMAPAWMLLLLLLFSRRRRGRGKSGGRRHSSHRASASVGAAVGARLTL